VCIDILFSNGLFIHTLADMKIDFESSNTERVVSRKYLKTEVSENV